MINQIVADHHLHKASSKTFKLSTLRRMEDSPLQKHEITIPATYWSKNTGQHRNSW